MPGVRYAVAHPAAVIGRALVADRARWPLWLPVAFAVGIGGYFALPWEPSLPVVLAPPLVLVALAWRTRMREGAFWAVLVLLFAALGLASAALRTAALDTVTLVHPLWADVEGVVERVERRPGDLRLTLGDARISADRRPQAAPRRVRVVVRALEAAPGIGDRVRLRARLSPPPPPSVPGGFDFQRSAFFDGLGAVGFAIGAPVTLSSSLQGGISLAVADLRSRVADRLSRALPGPTGAVAAALIVGERAGLDAATADAFRNSGLAHLLAISGLHMGLVAGTIFAVVRLALCLVPGFALRRPVKKLAACAALAGSAAYLVLAGAPVPTQRAFLMTGVVLCAILVDREAVSLRLVALAAFAVLVLRPDVLVGASFQLSFAAVIALVAVHEMWRRRAHTDRAAPAALWVTQGVRYVVGVGATSLIATLATAPFVTFHFQAIALGGVVANLLAVPLTAFVTMPAGIAGLLAMAVGAEAWVLPAMGVGIDTTLAVADWVVATTGPAAAVYPLPVAGLGAIALGGCWVAIWRTRLRWFGLLAILAGAGCWMGVRPPDVLVSADGRLSAVATDAVGQWAVSSMRGNRFPVPCGPGDGGWRTRSR
ncbi:MAG: ComEC/Rec2 family competence protein [Thalassobaculaceae bacterium]|nr:ComEC/Rec2 family competence protein [Thalassobaculaceae bacterium]